MERYNVRGENIHTGNEWHCEGPLSFVEAHEVARGYKKLESDYKIQYFVIPAETDV